MATNCIVSELEDTQRQLRGAAFRRSLPWLVLGAVLGVVGLTEAIPFDWGLGELTTGQWLVGLSFVPLLGTLKYWNDVNTHSRVLKDSHAAREDLRQAECSESIQKIEDAISRAREGGEHNPLVDAQLQARLPLLQARIKQIRKEEAQTRLNKEVQAVTSRIGSRLAAYKNALPIFVARAQVNQSLEFLETRKEELQKQWETAYEQFSWWNKLMYSGGPDFSEIDRMLKDLQSMKLRMDLKHKESFVVLESHFKTLETLARSRVLDATRKADDFIQKHGGEEGMDSDLLRKSLWFSVLSIPISLWADVDRAADVFDALRGVNGHFVGMSDSEIWWETLFLPTESLAGLAALTKGAYFEQLVAADSGGYLHEHFNHPGTDITVDGTALQVKATDSENYVNSVADGIPVIATSEVSAATGAIDSGYTNEELTSAVDLALGGTVVDIGDTTVDAIFAGVGGLGLFATFRGMDHAMKKHENGGDGVESVFEGAGVAIEGTASALVGAAEMGYKVLSSKPSRFVGRMFVKGLVKLDSKMMGDVEKK